jgi:hypothetical protein
VELWVPDGEKSARYRITNPIELAQEVVLVDLGCCQGQSGDGLNTLVGVAGEARPDTRGLPLPDPLQLSLVIVATAGNCGPNLFEQRSFFGHLSRAHPVQVRLAPARNKPGVHGRIVWFQKDRFDVILTVDSR